MPTPILPTRRALLRRGVALPAAALATAGPAPRRTALVRDRFWLWAHAAGSHNKSWRLPAPSRISPVEAAFYMSVPNLIMVRYEGDPAPPFDQYAVPFKALGQVVWSVVGAGGATEAAERDEVLGLAARNPNFTGVMMDDFFTGKKEGKVASLTVEELQALQKRLKSAPRKLDLWAVLYAHQLDLPVREHLAQCDVISYWTWKATELLDLRDNFARLEKLAPRARKVLGCYMWDYGQKQPMPINAMERQCTQGLDWLRRGRIDGMIFLATCICDLGLETVEWTRNWIRKAGAEKL